MKDQIPVPVKRFDFTTADSETAPELSFRGSTLTIKFRDWQDRSVVSEFRDVVGFRWSPECALHSGMLDDHIYEITASQWLGALSDANELAPGVRYRHIAIGFNSPSAFLEVICASIETQLSPRSNVLPPN